MADKSDEPKKEGGTKQLIMALVAVTLVGLGGGYAMGMFLYTPPDPSKPAAVAAAPGAAAADAHGAEKKAEGAHGEAKKKEGEGHGDAAAEVEEEDIPEPEPVDIKTMVVTQFPPVVTNLGNPKTVWIRVEGSVLSKKESEQKPELLAARAAEQILAYLRTLSLTDVQGADGINNLNQDLNEIMMNFSNGDVRQVLISGLIVE